MKFGFENAGLGSLRDARMTMSVGQRPDNAAQINILQVKRTLREKGPRAAIDYLDERIDAFLKTGDTAAAKQLLAEADGMINLYNEPGRLYYDLRLGVHHYKLGETGTARARFDRFIQEAKKRKNDAIWTAAARTFSQLDDFNGAIWCADQIGHNLTKHAVLINMVDLLVEQGRMFDATSILLKHCAPIARSLSSDNRSEAGSDVAKLTLIAEKLIAIENNQEASAIDKEIIEILKSWPSMTQFEIKEKEAIAVLLVKIGQRTEAIELMTNGWPNKEYLTKLTPDQLAAAKMTIIDTHFEMLSEALKS